MSKNGILRLGVVSTPEIVQCLLDELSWATQRGDGDVYFAGKVRLQIVRLHAAQLSMIRAFQMVSAHHLACSLSVFRRPCEDDLART
jgi:hypothetical protein